jgi:hypothetical protein
MEQGQDHLAVGNVGTVVMSNNDKWEMIQPLHLFPLNLSYVIS